MGVYSKPCLQPKSWVSQLRLTQLVITQSKWHQGCTKGGGTLNVSCYIGYCNEKRVFFTSEQPKNYDLSVCQKVCYVLHYHLDNVFIRFGWKLYRQI